MSFCRFTSVVFAILAILLLGGCSTSGSSGRDDASPVSKAQGFSRSTTDWRTWVVVEGEDSPHNTEHEDPAIGRASRLLPGDAFRIEERGANFYIVPIGLYADYLEKGELIGDGKSKFKLTIPKGGDGDIMCFQMKYRHNGKPEKHNFRVYLNTQNPNMLHIESFNPAEGEDCLVNEDQHGGGARALN